MTTSAHPVENVCAINRPISVFMLTTAKLHRTHSRQTFRRHICSHPVLQEHHAHSALFRASAPLSPRLQGQEGMQNLTRLDHHLQGWNKIILNKIIENYILKSQELRVNLTPALCALSWVGLHLHCSLTASTSCNSSKHWQIPELAKAFVEKTTLETFCSSSEGFASCELRRNPNIGRPLSVLFVWDRCKTWLYFDFPTSRLVAHGRLVLLSEAPTKTE
jgi:hypothetical protein